MGEGGVADCGKAQNCVEVCPKEIPLVDSIAVVSRADDEAHALRLAPQVAARRSARGLGAVAAVACELGAIAGVSPASWARSPANSSRAGLQSHRHRQRRQARGGARSPSARVEPGMGGPDELVRRGERAAPFPGTEAESWCSP